MSGSRSSAIRLLLLGLVVALMPCIARAELEHEVKAAYLFKFLQYVEWPAPALSGDGAPIVIGVLGAEDVRAALQDIVSDHMAQGRRVIIRAINPGESLSGLHVLFVGHSAAAELSTIAGQPGVLVVSESEGALDKGAMINLVRMGDRVRFEVAPEVANRSGLHISSRVLALASFVQKSQ